ncbi:MAG TPA: SurA N-terminal domain-containing protein [Bdellovibrionales bacterium]|nr:SurA N-terminal domain-containing protein [Bdellovibrionales bacterium]
MLDKMRRLLAPKKGKQSNITFKNWVAYALFGAIIVVFALWGVNSDQYGQTSGGVAAVVNESTISLAEYRNRVENAEQNARMRFDQFPETQKRALLTELRRRTLEEMIQGELLFQAADRRGVIAANSEVRDYILEIPFLQENGRFVRDRYRGFLQQMGLSTNDFERQVRKQIVTQKLQELFVGSAMPSREELKRSRALSEQKVNLRFVRLTDEDLGRLVAPAKVTAFKSTNGADIEKYYADNKIEFTKPEKFKAKHILIRYGDMRTEADAEKRIHELAKDLTSANFSAIAAKNSEDPGSKAKGGDLGEFERGRMVPEFEQAAAALKDGEISKPVKTSFGYHIIYLEKKTPAGQAPIAQVENEIARKLLVRKEGKELLGDLKKAVESGDRRELDTQMKKANLAWRETGEFDLSAPSIPQIGEAPDVLNAILKRNRAQGLIPELINDRDGYVLADVYSWKTVAAPAAGEADMDRMVAFRRAGELIESWAKDVEAKASIQRNPRL